MIELINGDSAMELQLILNESVDAVVTALVRGAFEYQGQKCSAASRAYIPDSIWPAVKDRMTAEMAVMTTTEARERMSQRVIGSTSARSTRGMV